MRGGTCSKKVMLYKMPYVIELKRSALRGGTCSKSALLRFSENTVVEGVKAVYQGCII